MNKSQILILTHIPTVPASITSVLREISKEFNIPIVHLKRNARMLKELNLIAYGDSSNFQIAELTELGKFIQKLLVREKQKPERQVKTRSGPKPLGGLIRDMRKSILRMIAEAGSGHLGASLSALEILAVLYFIKIRHDPRNPSWKERDRFILSKGHAAPALYCVLAEVGYFPPQELFRLRNLDSRLQGHPDTKTPGIDAMSGSLGQGLSIAVGIALAAKLDRTNQKVYILLGDGELDEGQVWEAAMTASHYRLDNIIAIIDRNQYQYTGSTEDIKSLEPLSEKWKAFGWEVIETDGHDTDAVLEALNRCDQIRGKPTVIIAKTTKGKGISFTEGNEFSNRVPNSEELRKALSEIG